MEMLERVMVQVDGRSGKIGEAHVANLRHNFATILSVLG